MSDPRLWQLIDAEVARVIQECHESAKRLLQEHRSELDALVAALMKRESLDEKEILAATGLPPAPQLPDRPKPTVTSGEKLGHSGDAKVRQ